MSVELQLLGGFGVHSEGTPCPPEPWRRRHAAALVKVLALAPGRSLHREQLIDLLWPELSIEEAAPRLHKAAHFARHGLPNPTSAIVLRGETISLLPDADVVVDAVRFEQAATDALENGTVGAAEAALACYAGELLPEDTYELWAEATRERLGLLQQRLLRQAERWEELLRLDPADEQAHVQLMEGYLRQGDRTSTLRQFERMDRALRHELGIAPGPAAVQLRDAALALRLAAAVPRPRPPEASGVVGREEELASLREVMSEVATGRGRCVLVAGPPGAGKTTMLDWIRSEAGRRGWRGGSGAAATIEGAWAYAPVLEALAELCRAHPALLDGLDDRYRGELDRRLSPAFAPGVGSGARKATPGAEANSDGGRQRLFVAASALLAVAGAAGTGVVLLFDDLHEADDATLQLLHYLARTTRELPILLVLAHRETAGEGRFAEFVDSLLRRDATVRLTVGGLDRAAAGAVVEAIAPHLTAPEIEQIWQLSGGIPFALTELARVGTRAADGAAAASPGAWVTARLPGPTRDLLSRIAVLGLAFDTDEFVALSDLPDELAYARLEAALATGIIESTGSGYRFRHPLIREQLLADLAPHRRVGLHRVAASQLDKLGASPARIGHHLVAAGDVGEAVPYLLRAAKAETAVGAYRDALALLKTIGAAGVTAERAEVASLRGDLLAALADPGSVEAYREAARLGDGELRRGARAKLAKMAILFGDLATGADALAGLELNGGPHDSVILLARANLAFFTGDLDTAQATADQARALIVTGDEDYQLLDLVGLQGLLAHSRGEWFERLSQELQNGRQAPQVAAAVFDSHLCVAEYLLYGPTPYARVIELARSLRETALRAGVLRAVGFASALLGEAALLSGDLELAERELADAADLHAEIGARAGESHCLQRLAEVRLAYGDRSGARRLCERAIPMARWSPIAPHLLQRLYGTLISAAADPQGARDALGRADATMDESDACPFCSVMLEVPAATACADLGDVAAAERHLEAARRSASMWDGTSWQAAICEAEAHLAGAQGRLVDRQRLIEQAERIFVGAGQPIDAERCRAFASGSPRFTALSDPSRQSVRSATRR